MSIKRQFTLYLAEKRKKILIEHVKEDENFLLDVNDNNEILDELMGRGVYTEDLDDTIEEMKHNLVDEELLENTLSPYANTLWRKAEKLQDIRDKDNED